MVVSLHMEVSLPMEVSLVMVNIHLPPTTSLCTVASLATAVQAMKAKEDMDSLDMDMNL